jgi:hypothetical protein
MSKLTSLHLFGAPLPSRRRVRNVLFSSLFALLVYYTLFRLPFWFPPQKRLVSASYAFGFNNSVAILALVGLLGAVTLLYLIRRRESAAPPIAFPPERAPHGHRWMSIGVMSIVALCYAGLTFLMYLYNVRCEPFLTWETRHLLYRTLLMDVYGLHPWSEVAAEYGPILTYAPLYMYWLLKPFGASHELAYFACHLVLNLAGLWCAYYVLSRTIMPAHARVVAFGVLAVAGFALYMGINGALVRYLFPFASVLLGHRAVAWGLSRRARPEFWASTIATVLLLFAGNVLLSSDAGVAFALAWLGYAVLMLRCDVRVLAVSVVALIIAAVLCWLFLPAAYYETLLRFSEGANNLPLLPVPHLLLYIATLFMVVPPLLVVSLRKQPAGDLPAAAICGALGLLCLAMAPGALGRCDPPHVLLFGMGASMLLMIRLANISRGAFVVYVIAYASVFIVLMQVINLQVFYRLPPRALLSSRAIANIAQKLRTVKGTSHPSMDTLSKLDSYPRLGLPFASFGDPAVERYVLSRHQLEPEYYVSIVGVYTPAALERKLRDVGKMEYLLVPRAFALRPDPSAPGPCLNYLKNLQQWFLYPATLPCRAEPLDPIAVLKSFIVDHYRPVEKVGSWLVMCKITGASPVQHDQ